MHESISSVVETYTKRFCVRKPYFTQPPATELCMIITIPAYKEPNVLDTLKSLENCQPPSGTVEVIITINAPEDASDEVLAINEKTVRQIKQWEQNKKSEYLKTFIIREEAIAKTHAGAGYARKIGMDEAVQRWAWINKDGPIICLDADCKVSENYFVEAERAFANPLTKGGHFYFEHNYSEEPDAILREGILQYELHLRCYIHGLKLAGYPFAMHTVGSCIAVRASSYAKAGGMNKRKAGEDFYFMHKLVPLGGWKNIVGATVFPSCRASDRVPFGTGRAQSEWQMANLKQGVKLSPPEATSLLTYNASIYQVMRPVFEHLPNVYTQDVNLDQFEKAVSNFLTEVHLMQKIAEKRQQANSPQAFAKRLWQWMDGFMVLKFTHYLRDNGYPNQPILDVARTLLTLSGESPSATLAEVLAQFRQLDRQA